MRIVANIISWLFHPIFVPVYILMVAIFANPATFRFLDRDPVLMIITVAINTVLLPLAAIGIMKPLGFIRSFKMEGRMERIIPYVAGLFFYIWTVVVFYKQGNTPMLFLAPLAGTLAALILAFLTNVLFIKISLHAVAMGVATSYFIAAMPMMEKNVFPVLLIVILLAGLVGSARLLLRAHDDDEVYLGYLIGMVGQMAALHIIL